MSLNKKKITTTRISYCGCSYLKAIVSCNPVTLFNKNKAFDISFLNSKKSANVWIHCTYIDHKSCEIVRILQVHLSTSWNASIECTHLITSSTIRGQPKPNYYQKSKLRLTLKTTWKINMYVRIKPQWKKIKSTEILIL